MGIEIQCGEAKSLNSGVNCQLGANWVYQRPNSEREPYDSWEKAGDLANKKARDPHRLGKLGKIPPPGKHDSQGYTSSLHLVNKKATPLMDVLLGGLAIDAGGAGDGVAPGTHGTPVPAPAAQTAITAAAAPAAAVPAVPPPAAGAPAVPLTYTAREQDDDPTVPRARNFGARTTVSGCITRSNGLDVDAHVYPNLVNWGKWNTLQFTSSMEFGEMASAAPHGHVHFAFDIRISDLSTETRKRASAVPFRRLAWFDLYCSSG